jgi:capsular polysaccharide biosynthesis protein
MILQPGLMKMDEEGNMVYTDSPENIKAIIESGALNDRIVNNLKNFRNIHPSASLHFKVNIDRKTNILKIDYETGVIDEGIYIMNQLAKDLSSQYSEFIRNFQEEYDEQIQTKKSDLVLLMEKKQLAKKNVANIHKRLKYLESSIKSLQNSKNLSAEQERNLLNDSDGTSSLKLLLYKNNLQYNLALINKYEDQITDYTQKSDETTLKLKEIEEKIAIESKRMEDLNRKKSNLHGIKVFQSPIGSQNPIKPKTKLNVMLSTVGGFFLLLFLAFFLEYVSKYRRRE